MDEEDLDESFEHQLAARSIAASFSADQSNERRKLLYSTHVDNTGQKSCEEVRVVGIENEVTAEEAHVGFTLRVAVANLFGRSRAYLWIIESWFGGFKTGQGESGSGGEKDKVAFFQIDGWVPIDGQTAASA